MAHTSLYELRFQLFIIAVLHIPQHQRRKEVFPFQAFQRIFVHAAGRDQDQSAGFSRIFLHIDLRDHTAVTRTHKNGIFNAELLKKGVHSGNKLLICTQLLRIVEQEHPAVTGQSLYIVHPHFKRIHTAIQEHERSADILSVQDITALCTADGDRFAWMRCLK